MNYNTIQKILKLIQKMSVTDQQKVYKIAENYPNEFDTFVKNTLKKIKLMGEKDSQSMEEIFEQEKKDARIFMEKIYNQKDEEELKQIRKSL